MQTSPLQLKKAEKLLWVHACGSCI